MCKYHRLSPPKIPLVISPVFECSILIELGACCVVLDPIPALLVKPTVHDFDIALALIIALLLETVLDLQFALLGHAQVIGAVELEVVPFVVLAKVLACVVCTRLVVILLEAELSELSHCAVGANKSKGLFILPHVDIGAGILIGSHVTKGDHCDVVRDLFTLSPSSHSWPISSHVEEEQWKTDNQE